MNPPHASTQALFEGLDPISREFIEKTLASLSDEQRLESTRILAALTAGMAQDCAQWREFQQRYYQRHLELWMSLANANDNPRPEPMVEPDKSDRRFRAAEWQQLPYFDYLKQAYLLNSRWLSEWAEAAHLDPPTKNKLRFYTRQLIDAAAPANYTATNPEVLALASATRGESLARGAAQLNEDLQKGRISMTDETAFQVGRNIAVTPGMVVFENELMQLIQYLPATEAVYERPLLMVPPCINKFYILDLQPENSFVRYAVAQGHTVFMVSWRNMPEDMGHVTWEQYVELGVIRATEAACDICGVDKINVLGFCIGGTLLGAALAVLQARNRPLAGTVTLLAAMLDFSDTGELSVLVDETYVRAREQDEVRKGVLQGRTLGLTFSSLRANDLIWHYVVNNYLKGRKPAAFDLLYWNSDSTNLPGTMYAYYLRNMYLENNLRHPDRLTMCGVPVDLSRIRTPAYILASRDDHIVPWRTAYESTRLIGSEIEFVLTASGHIAGVINPAAANRRHYWRNSRLPAVADDWLAGATELPGSWWLDWSRWLAERSGPRVPAPAQAGNARHPQIEPAPGRYVRQRCD